MPGDDTEEKVDDAIRNLRAIISTRIRNATVMSMKKELKRMHLCMQLSKPPGKFSEEYIYDQLRRAEVDAIAQIVLLEKEENPAVIATAPSLPQI